jgi:hypothetical protein
VYESCRLNRGRVLCLTVFAAAWLPAAFSQVATSFVSPAAAATVTPPVVTPNQMDLIDKVLGMVGPSEPTHLTQKDRFQQYLLSTGGPMPLLGEAAGAGISQGTNSPPEWGQGWGAFGERYGSNLAYNGVRQTISYGASIAFHEDTRYFASGRHGFWGRTGYALLSTFTARRPDGRQSFSVSSVSGVVGASAISSIWGPDSWKGVHNIADNAGVSFGATAALNIVREFLPDLLGRPRGDDGGAH